MKRRRKTRQFRIVTVALRHAPCLLLPGSCLKATNCLVARRRRLLLCEAPLFAAPAACAAGVLRPGASRGAPLPATGRDRGGGEDQEREGSQGRSIGGWRA